MAWKQVRTFNINKMGRKSGWCLQNCAKGFGIDYGQFASAKADMESQMKNGTLHPLSTLPTNVAIPVYIDTNSKYEHVEVYDRGTWYSDGKKVSAPASKKVFGWGELCDGRRVVEWINDGFLPPKGYWKPGDIDPRIGELSTFMYRTFPAYTDKRALGNYYGKFLTASIKEFQRRTNLKPVDGCVGKETYAMLKKYGFKG